MMAQVHGLTRQLPRGCLYILLLCCAATSWAIPTRLGDLDEDGQITVLDLVRLVGHIRGTARLQPEIAAFADVNQDGAVNDTDAQIISEFILEIRPLPTIPLTRVRETSPANGEVHVAVTRETVFRLTLPLAPETLIANSSLQATFGGRRLLSRIEIASDRRTITLFYLEPVPAGARVRVTFNGTGIKDFIGREIDPDGDGVSGGTLAVDFDTLTTGAAPGTAVTGRVFASELAPGGSPDQLVNRPLSGVTVTVDGREESLRAVTDKLGNFRLDPAPPGRFFVHIDGRTARTDLPGPGYPNGSYYPSVGKEWVAQIGEETSVGSIYLPLVTAGTLQPVSSSVETSITFPSDVLAARPELQGVQLTVPANSLFSDNGARGGRVGIAPVAPDRLPSPLPPGLDFPLVITVQTDGGSNFDRPVPVCFPNLPDPKTGALLKPGEKSALWSFNHDTGDWEIVGPMTVSEDGRLVCSDPGTGILQPGWHGSRPGSEVQGGNTYGSNPPNPTRPRSTGQQECAHNECPCDGNCSTGRSVLLQSGEEILTRVDLMIPGRAGMDFVMQRTYRSRLDYDGPIGFGWNFLYNETLFIEANGDVARFNGRSHEGLWRVQPDGTYTAPSGYFSILSRNPDGSYELTEQDGFQRRYGSDGRLQSHRDRFGNAMYFDHDHRGNLKRVIDVFGREIEFEFTTSADGTDRLTSITDFTGRRIQYGYDDQGDLVSVTGPKITGTSTGNDFPEGRTERYTYSRGFAHAELNHNILSVTAPVEAASDGPPFLQWTYGTDPADPMTFDKVLTETEGGTNASGIAAGGTMKLEYRMVAENQGAPAGQPDLPRGMARITERNGNQKEFFVNERSQHILTRELTRGLRPGEPAAYETRSFYNEDGLLVRRVFPEGNEFRYRYDSGAPRRNQANLLELRMVPDARRGGGADLVTTYTYEPLFNQVLTVTDPRGNNPGYVPPLGATHAGRYTTRYYYDYQESSEPVPLAALFNVDLSGVTRGLGDLNGDGVTSQTFGNLVRVEGAPVQLSPESNEARTTGSTSQRHIQETQWNNNGQRTAQIDAAGNVVEFEYYAENDPDGDGSVEESAYLSTGARPVGYLKSIIRDSRTSPRRSPTAPAPSAISITFGYNRLGIVTTITDPRGVRNAYEVNQANEVVSIIRGMDVTKAGETGQLLTGEAPFGYKTRFRYDANGRTISTEVENRDETAPDAGGFIQNTIVYDILGHPVATSQEVDDATVLTTRYRYDANDLLVEKIEPAGNRFRIIRDERNLPMLLVKAAESNEEATLRMDYDKNGNRISATDAEDDDGDGRPGISRIDYDGFDRAIRRSDAAGNFVELEYDPASNPVKTRFHGTNPGLAPGSTTLLREEIVSFDEQLRPFRKDRRLFIPEGNSPRRTAKLQDQDNNGYVTDQFEFDALGRLVFRSEDDGGTQAFRYDGAGRLLEFEDAAGNKVLSTYDKSSNRIRVTSVQTSGRTNLAQRTMTSWMVYDQIGRLVRVTDSAGQTARYGYDSRDNLIFSTDAEGTIAADPLSLSPAPINTTGNVSRMIVDGAGRLRSVIKELRDNDRGSGALDLSNPANPDGMITVQYDWDANSRLTSIRDDKGNSTRFEYDAQNRRRARHNADGTKAEFTYSRDGHVRQSVAPDGTVKQYTRDELGRVLKIEVLNPAPGLVGTRIQTFAYDGLSRLVESTDDNGNSERQQTFRILYDSLSRPVEQTQNDQILSATYGGDGQRISRVLPSGLEILADHDVLNRVISQRVNGRTMVQHLWGGPAHRELERINGNATTASHLNAAGTIDSGFDAVLRPIRHNVKGPEGMLMDREYTYSRTGLRTSEKRNDDLGLTDRYQFDAAYRIKTVEMDVAGAAGGVRRETTSRVYQLDGVGNRRNLTETRVNGTRQIEEYQSSLMNEYEQIGGTRLLHSRNGNLTDDGTRTYSYDAFDRLTVVNRKSDGARLAEYAYDSLNRRRLKSTFTATGTTASTTLFYYDGFQICEERSRDNTLLTSYLHSPEDLDSMVAFIRSEAHPQGPGTFYYHQNSRLDVAMVTDQQGRVVERRFYDESGRTFDADKMPALASAIGNRFGFQGRELDEETGLYYFRSRYYDPQTGRFLQRDPVWDTANSGNAYTFVGNNPVSWTDPLGLDATSATFDAVYGLADSAVDLYGQGSTMAEHSGQNPSSSGFNPQGSDGLTAAKAGADIFNLAIGAAALDAARAESNARSAWLTALKANQMARGGASGVRAASPAAVAGKFAKIGNAAQWGSQLDKAGKVAGAAAGLIAVAQAGVRQVELEKENRALASSNESNYFNNLDEAQALLQKLIRDRDCGKITQQELMAKMEIIQTAIRTATEAWDDSEAGRLKAHIASSLENMCNGLLDTLPGGSSVGKFFGWLAGDTFVPK